VTIKVVKQLDKFRRFILAIEPASKLTSFQANYLMAMLEHRANQINASVPDWLNKTMVLQTPYYGTVLKELKIALTDQFTAGISTA